MEKILNIHYNLINTLHLQKYVSFNNYVLSPYVIKIQCEDGELWYNNLTCELLLLKENELQKSKINRYLKFFPSIFPFNMN